MINLTITSEVLFCLGLLVDAQKSNIVVLLSKQLNADDFDYAVLVFN
jgi:hypothetical protein